jgi:nondiscriminating aspartyl-tRNA synthetase
MNRVKQASTATNRIRTSQLAEFSGQQVQLHGWLHALRRMGKIAFLILRDGWGTAQIVVEDPAILNTLEEQNIMPESVLQVTGDASDNHLAPGGVELHNPKIEIVTPVREPLPVLISKREINAGLTTLLDHATTANRHPARRAIYRLAAAMMRSFRSHLNSQGFTEIQTPKLVAAATEGGANVFAVDYFDSRAFLAQSPQFYKQIMVGVFERVYEVGPVFRAEPHDTVRHINEYVSLDAEMGFIEDHHTVMAQLRAVLAHMLEQTESTCAAELSLLNARLPALPAEIPTIDFLEAQSLLYGLHQLDVRGEPDLSPQDERLLGEWAQREFESDFLFVTGYPLRKRPFYTHPDPNRPEQSNSFDLLFRGTELVTGGQRLHRYADYLDALVRTGQSQEPYAAYLEAFRFGMPPHGGFAIGLERLLMQLLGLSNIRLATLFPRDLNRLSP